MADASLIDKLEYVLEVPFTPEYVRRIKFTAENFGFAAQLLQFAFQHLELPPKLANNEIRPAYYRPKVPWMFGGPVRMDSIPAVNVKQVLLYSDAVAIDIIPILGRLRMACEPRRQDLGMSLTRDIEQNLYEISEFAELIKHRIVIPFDGSFETARNPIGTHIDPLFWSRAEAESYITNIRSELGLFSSSDIKRPFYNAILSEIPCVNPDRVSWQDILSLRRDEEIFQQWRDLMHSILKELYDRKHDFTDIENEFKEVSGERFREWNESLKVQRMRRGALDALFAGARQISLQWIGAALAAAAVAAAMESKTATAFAGGAAVAGLLNTGPAIISAFGEVWQAISSHEERLSLEHHILALGL